MTETMPLAPDFTLPADDGSTLRLSELRGAPVVLFFYPRDDTSGCTAEAKGFTEAADDFAKAGARVLGLSKDSVQSHARFRDKHALGVTLLSDAEGTTAEDYGVWKEKSMYGKRFHGIERSTFLIDAEGRIAREWRRVKVPGHVQEVLDAVRAL